MQSGNPDDGELSHYQLHEIKHGIFGRAEVLVTSYALDWDDRDFQRYAYPAALGFPNELWGFSHLQKLSIQNCPHLTVPKEIGNLANLKVLSLDHCYNIQSLPPSIGKLVNLERLILNTTSLQTLPPEVGRLSKLEVLHLDNNEHLASLPIELQHTPLKRLELLNHNFPTLPDTTFALDTLTELHLEVCEELQEIPPMIGRLTNLEFFEIRYCHGLSELPMELGLLTKLKGLWLHATEIITIPASIGQLINLHSLSIRSSSMMQPPNGIANLSNLHTLELQCKQVGLGQPAGVLVDLSKLVNLEIVTSRFLGLSSPLLQRLKTLHLTTTDTTAVPTLFAEPWWKDCELEELELHMCGSSSDFVGLLRCLPSSLSKLSICKCNIDNFDHLLTESLPERIRGLAFTNCSRWNKPVERQFVARLIERYQELGSITGSIDGALSHHNTYLLCLNSSGRVLLNREASKSSTVPLCVWSTVLARVKTACAIVCTQHLGLQNHVPEEMEASVIYALLHGRALLCRSEAPELVTATGRKRKVVDVDLA